MHNIIKIGHNKYTTIEALESGLVVPNGLGDNEIINLVLSTRDQLIDRIDETYGMMALISITIMLLSILFYIRLNDVKYN